MSEMNIGDWISLGCIALMVSYFVVLIIGGIICAVITEERYTGWD